MGCYPVHRQSASRGRPSSGARPSAQQEKLSSSTSCSTSAPRVVAPPWPEPRSGNSRYGPPAVASDCSLATIFSGSYGGAVRSLSADTNAITGYRRSARTLWYGEDPASSAPSTGSAGEPYSAVAPPRDPNSVNRSMSSSGAGQNTAPNASGERIAAAATSSPPLLLPRDRSRPRVVY